MIRVIRYQQHILVSCFVLLGIGCSKQSETPPQSNKPRISYEETLAIIERDFPSHQYVTNDAILQAMKGTPSSSEPTKITIGLPWVRNDQFSPLYIAEQQGFFAEENLSIEIIPGGLTTDGLTLLMARKIDFSISSAGSNLIRLLTANRNNDPNLIAIGAVLRKHPFGFVLIDDTLPQNQKPNRKLTGEDFKGKTIGMDPKARFLTEYALGRLDLSMDDVTITRTANSIDPLITGAFDIMSVWMDNIPRMLEERGYQNWNAWVFADEGWPDQGNVLVTRGELLKENPELVSRFLRAVHRGVQYIIDDPDQAASVVYTYLKGYDSSLTKSLISKRLHYQANLAKPKNENDPLLLMDLDQWNQTAAIMLQHNSIEIEPAQ